MSVAAIGADKVHASPVAQFMIHLPSLRTEGDSVEHKRSLQALNSFKASVLNAYELKCAGKKTRSELDAMLRAETWMPVQDAMAAGFVVMMCCITTARGVIASQAVMCAQSGIRALATSGGLPTPPSCGRARPRWTRAATRRAILPRRSRTTIKTHSRWQRPGSSC